MKCVWRHFRCDVARSQALFMSTHRWMPFHGHPSMAANFSQKTVIHWKQNKAQGVKAQYSDVLLTCILLRLDQSGGSLNADEQGASHLGVQSACVPSLLHLQDSLQPRNNLMRQSQSPLTRFTSFTNAHICARDNEQCGIYSIPGPFIAQREHLGG